MVKRNYGLNCFRNLDEDLFEYAFEHNLTCLEIHLDKTHITLDTFSPEKIEKINQLAKKTNISLSLHNPYTINASDIIPIFRKIDTRYITKSIELAKKLNATHITSHIGNFYWFPVEKWMRKKALDRFLKSMDYIINLCEKCDVTFALENLVPIPHGSEYYFLGDNIDDFNYLFERLHSGHFMFCLDTGHANIGEGVVPYIECLGEKTKIVHYHDNKGSNDNHLPIGEGIINWKEVVKALDSINYNGSFISECQYVKPHEAAERFEKYFTS